MNQTRFVSRLLCDYKRLPDTSGHVRPADRRLAQRLFNDGVPLPVVLAAFRVAISRRRARPNHKEPLQTIRSLYYFLPVIEEALLLPSDYLDYIAGRTGDNQSGCEPRKQPTMCTFRQPLTLIC